MKLHLGYTGATSCILIICLSIVTNCQQPRKSIFLSPDLVRIGGSQGNTVIRNSTSDTLAISGSFFHYLPYKEFPFRLSLPPNTEDTLAFDFTYPDFVFLFLPSYLRIYNGPNGTVKCDIKQYSPEKASVLFSGDFKDINNYYLAYHNTLGSSMEENSPYFDISSRLKDFNTFPRLADSIALRSLDFITSYSEPLPNWFRSHEEWRLKYRTGFLKYNTLISREFYGGRKLDINDSLYFLFENELPIGQENMVLNTDFLWYTHFYLRRHAAKLPSRRSSDSQLDYIDSLFSNSEVCDILRMQRLSTLARTRDSIKTYPLNYNFKNAKYKNSFDSLVSHYYSLPKLGEAIPKLDVFDLSNRPVSIGDYRARFIILNFWATWCGPCIKEFPYENRIYQAYKKDGLIVVNVCIDSDRARWESVSKRHNLQVINLFSNKVDFASIVNLFGIAGLPKSILLDKDLKVLDNNFTRASQMSEATIKAFLSKTTD